MLLIDDRPEPRPPWRPNWRVVAWLVAAGVIGYASLSAHGALGAALMVVAFGAICRAFTVALPYGEGLTEWRQ
jgi:fatty acid desaturase